MSITEFCSSTSGWTLSGRDPRAFRNPQTRTGAVPVVELRPGATITLFSLPTTIEAMLGHHVARRALRELEIWKNELPVRSRDTATKVVAYFEPEHTLRIVEEHATLARPKFGAGEGLATSSKPRVSSRRSFEKARISLNNAS